MDIKDVKLKKGMSKEEVNKLISEWLLLEDDVYMGNAYSHDWKCKCGNIIKGRMWAKIKSRIAYKCTQCILNKKEERYKKEVENTGEYEYIRSYSKGDILPDGRTVGDNPYIQIKHIYCGSVYELTASSFINDNRRCGKCCSVYENSIAHYIGKTLNLKIGNVWDFEKNTLNPYHVSKSCHKVIWIKCQEKEYHGSYEIDCRNFIRATKINETFGCPYCHSKKIHPKDSFAQYHIDNTDKDFLEKYWDYDKNTVDPWGISPSSNKKVWIKCVNEDVNKLNRLKKKDYHDSYKIACNSFTQGSRCSYCACRKIHPYDSFGYHHFDKVQSWHPDNEISPFKIAVNSGKRYKFICHICKNIFTKRSADITYNGYWCPQCSKSKGERKIEEWLRYNSIKYISQKKYDDLIGLKGGFLSYDFCLTDYNLLIEYQGEYHDGSTSNQTKECLIKQQEHDRRKREYAEENNIKLLEIWYWDFDNIEFILEKEIKNI